MSWSVYCKGHRCTDSVFNGETYEDRIEAEHVALTKTEEHRRRGLDCEFSVRDTVSEPAQLGPLEVETMLLNGYNPLSEEAPLWQATPAIPEEARQKLNEILSKRPPLLKPKDMLDMMSSPKTMHNLRTAMTDWLKSCPPEQYETPPDEYNPGGYL